MFPTKWVKSLVVKCNSGFKVVTSNVTELKVITETRARYHLKPFLENLWVTSYITQRALVQQEGFSTTDRGG